MCVKNKTNPCHHGAYDLDFKIFNLFKICLEDFIKLKIKNNSDVKRNKILKTENSKTGMQIRRNTISYT